MTFDKIVEVDSLVATEGSTITCTTGANVTVGMDEPLLPSVGLINFDRHR